MTMIWNRMITMKMTKKIQKTQWAANTSRWLEIFWYCIIMAACMALGFAIIMKFSDPIKIELPNVNLQQDTGDLQQFIMVATRFKDNHQYSAAYNCVNYSQDLKNIADQLGFKTKVMFGCPEGNGTCHEWLKLEVDFEPQTGKFTDYSRDYPNDIQEVR